MGMGTYDKNHGNHVIKNMNLILNTMVYFDRIVIIGTTIINNDEDCIRIVCILTIITLICSSGIINSPNSACTTEGFLLFLYSNSPGNRKSWSSGT